MKYWWHMDQGEPGGWFGRPVDGGGDWGGGCGSDDDYDDKKKKTTKKRKMDVEREEARKRERRGEEEEEEEEGAWRSNKQQKKQKKQEKRDTLGWDAEVDGIRHGGDDSWTCSRRVDGGTDTNKVDGGVEGSMTDARPTVRVHLPEGYHGIPWDIHPALPHALGMHPEKDGAVQRDAEESSASGGYGPMALVPYVDSAAVQLHRQLMTSQARQQHCCCEEDTPMDLD